MGEGWLEWLEIEVFRIGSFSAVGTFWGCFGRVGDHLETMVLGPYSCPRLLPLPVVEVAPDDFHDFAGFAQDEHPPAVVRHAGVMEGVFQVISARNRNHGVRGLGRSSFGCHVRTKEIRQMTFEALSTMGSALPYRRAIDALHLKWLRVNLEELFGSQLLHLFLDQCKGLVRIDATDV